MDFYYKYIKYKQKYLNLSKNQKNQIGGLLPSNRMMKNINLFDVDTQIELHLNPIYGYIWNKYNVANNYYNFYDKNNYISFIIQRLFHSSVNNSFKVNIELEKTSSHQWGIFLGKLFLLKTTTDICNLNLKCELFQKIINNLEFLKKNKNNTNDKITIIKINVNKELLALGIIKENYTFNEKNCIKLLNKLNPKNNELNKERKKLLVDFNTKYKLSSTTIFKKINTGTFNLPVSYIYNYLQDIAVYNSFLAVAIWTMRDKNAIKDYYLGLNSVLPEELNVIIPENYETDFYTYSELDFEIYNDIVNNESDHVYGYDSDYHSYYEDEPSSTLVFDRYLDEKIGTKDHFTFAIVSLIIIYKNSIDLYGQGYAKPDKCLIKTEDSKTLSTYPDCGESTLRNFINILTYDKENDKFDIEKLERLKPNDKLKEYYRVFNTVVKQSNENVELEIFGKKLTPRYAWDLVVSNFSKVKYNKNCKTAEDDSYNYELMDGLSEELKDGKYVVNVLQLIKNLFLLVNDWKDFNDDDTQINVNLSTDGFGKISIENKNGSFDWDLEQQHYAFTEKKEGVNRLNFKLGNKEFFEKILKIKYNFYEYHTDYKNKIPNWWYYITFKPDILTEFFNDYAQDYISNEEYQAIFNFIENKFNDDQKRFIYIDYFKLENLEMCRLEKYANKIKYNDKHELIQLETIDKFDKILNNLPNTLIYLTFGRNFNQLVNHLPCSLTHLTFGHSFNKPVNNLPNNLTHLTFGWKFNQNVDNLPNYLTYLKFGSDFNQNVDKLPKNLTYLQFGNYFNQNVDNLPNDLTHLILGTNFNQKIDNLPKQLIHIELTGMFNQQINFLPKSLTYLSFFYAFNQSIVNLPPNLTDLILSSNFNMPIDYLPNKITHLTLGNTFNQSVNNLPTDLKKLTFGESFNKSVNYLPTNLMYLHFGNNFNQSVDKLPTNLMYLTFGNNFNQSVTNLPNKLTYLIFGDSFNQNIDHLPDSLTHIIFGEQFNQNVHKLPSNIKIIKCFANTHFIFNKFIDRVTVKIYYELDRLRDDNNTFLSIEEYNPFE